MIKIAMVRAKCEVKLVNMLGVVDLLHVFTFRYLLGQLSEESGV